MSTPKIFVFREAPDRGDALGQALAEDGDFLAAHVSSDYGWFRHDMGLAPDVCKWQHEHYAKHYPDGYELVEVSKEECLAHSHAGLEAAYAAHLAKTTVSVPPENTSDES